jgi:hypothetical protein
LPAPSAIPRDHVFQVGHRHWALSAPAYQAT